MIYPKHCKGSHIQTYGGELTMFISKMIELPSNCDCHCCFWHVADLPLLTCCTCSLMLNRGVGVGGLITFLTTLRQDLRNRMT